MHQEWAKLLGGAVLLQPDNFTPLSRTPWGGEVIGRRYKAALVPDAVGLKVGEAWEFSAGPDFPSRVLGGPSAATLAELAERCPEAVHGGLGIELLVKLLDASEPLSLQVHPGDDDPNLAVHECGKPESWLVLAAAPGAVLYLGFARAVGAAELRAALLDGARAKELLHAVPVAPGDYFEIAPGVAHAIGAGVTLLEPQRVRAGLSGKTFRMWDWGRSYGGKPRDLHVAESLALVDAERQVGEAFVRTLRRRPASRVLPGGAQADVFPRNDYCQLASLRLPAGGSVRVGARAGARGAYAVVIMLAGELQAGDVVIRGGHPALLPAAALPLTLAANAASELALIVPAAASLELS